MTLQKIQGVRMSAAVGASVGVGTAVYRDFAPSLGWPAALLLCMVVSAAVAAGTSLLLGMFLKPEKSQDCHSEQ